MMYSQQEYDQVRRQTMQLEAEKRAVLRMSLLVVSALLVLALLLLGIIYARYSRSDSLTQAAEERAAALDKQLQQTNQELSGTKAELEKFTGAVARRNETVERLTPKVLGKAAGPGELAEYAHAIYQMPGHMIEIPRIPPDNILRRHRYAGSTYVLVAGLVKGQWILYSNLVG